ncbi:MAG: cytochrome P450 [Nocardioides sp.]|nr:cytochrome P450 [Nocardioides sp.]
MPRPPGPRGHWLTGNLEAFERDRLGFMQDVHQQFGPVVAFDRRTTLLADPEMIAKVLRSPSVGIPHDVLLRPVSRQQARDLASVKLLLSPVIRRSQSCEVGPLVNDELGAAVRRCVRRAASSGTLEVEPVTFLEPVISAAVNTYFFGPIDGAHIAPRVSTLLNDLSRLISNPLAPPASWRTPLRRRIEAQYEALSAVVAAVLDQRRADAAPDVATRIITQRQSGNYSSRFIAQMLIGAALAAQRVPAAAAAWMLHLIATNPQVQEKIRTYGTARAYDGTNTYVQAVVLESLRLYPTTWLLQRTVEKSLLMAGHTFEAGHTLLMSPYVVQRAQEHFERPDEFSPTRWLRANNLRTARSGFMPFGDGVRVCPGRHIAAQVLVTVAEKVRDQYDLTETSSRVQADPRTTLLPVGSRLLFRPLAS